MTTARAKRLSLFIAAVAGVAVAFVFVISPLKAYFGIVCPGCGSTRAVAALLHGDIADAFYWHPLFPFYFMWTGVFAYYAARHFQSTRRHVLDFTFTDLEAILSDIFGRKLWFVLVLLYAALFFGVWIVRLTGIVEPTILAPLR